MATEMGPYEGRAGGKFRKRPVRNPSTPYDRPANGPHALRNPLTDEKRNGWLSRIVNPASRIITSNATRFFASIFQKRLTVSARNPDVKFETVYEHPKQEHESKQEEFAGREERETEGSMSNRIEELEQMLKDKTLSRDEFNHLTEILQSRVVDSSIDSEGKRVPVTSLKAATTLTTKNDINTSMLGDMKKLVADETTASPAEIAKAFMGDRPATLSPHISGLRTRTYGEFASLTPNAQSLSHVLKPATTGRFLGHSGWREDAFLTPESRGGRCVPYSPSASVYSRHVTEADGEANSDGYIGISKSSHWAQANDSPSSSRQVRKRRSSIFENDIGSISSIRRIRQKSNLMPAFKGFGIPASPIPLPSLRPDVCQSSFNALQRPVQLPFSKSDLSTSNQTISNGGHKFASVPPQSSERARKILEEIDRTVPSPKEKTTELRLAIAREKSPAKLTVSMLGGKALRSMEGVNMAKLPDQYGIALHGSGNADKWSLNEKKDKIEENGLAETSEKTIKTSSKDGLMNGISPFADSISSLKGADSSARGHLQNKRPFQMSAPEMDGDGCNLGEAFATSLVQIEKGKLNSEASMKKPLIPEKKAATAIGLLLNNGVQNGSNCSFSVIPPSKSLSEASITPALPLPVYNKAVETTEPAVEKSSIIPLNSSASAVTDASSQNISGETKNESSDKSIAKEITATHQTNSASHKEVEGKVEETATLAFTSASSSPSLLFGFSTSSALSLSNGFSYLSTPASHASFAPVTPVSAVLKTTTSSHLTSQSASTNVQFGAGKLSTTSAVNSSPSSSMSEPPDLAAKVSGKPSLFGKIVSSSPMMISAQSEPVSSTAVTTTAIGSSPPKSITPSVNGKSEVSASTFGSTVPSVVFQLPQAGTGGGSIKDSWPSQLGSSGSLPTFVLSAASTFGSGSLSFSSGPTLNSSSSSSATSFGTVNQATTTQSTVSSNPFGISTQSQSLFSSGFSSSSTGISGFSCGGSSSGAALLTSGLSFGGLAASGASSTAGFSFGGSSGGATPNAASTGFAFGGLSSGSASTSPATGSLAGTSASAAMSPGFSFGGSSVSASISSSSTAGFSVDGSSMGSSASLFSATGFSFGLSSVGSGTSLTSTSGFSVGGSPMGNSTSGFTFGGSSAGSTASSSSTASFSFGATLAGSSSSPTAGFSFGLSSAASSPATTAFSFGAGAVSSPVSTAFSYQSSTSSNGMPFSFGSSSGTSASSGSLFSFTASASSAPSLGFASKTSSIAPAQPIMTFASASPGNDQMNIEDSMAEDTVQASMPVTPAFAMSSPASSNFMFGSPTIPTGGQPGFSFGAPQGLSTPQAPSPFAAGGGSLEFAGGSFSLGTSGADKSGRKILRIKRDKGRKK